MNATISEIRINWMNNYGNRPEFDVCFSDTPTYKKPPGILWSRLGEQVVICEDGPRVNFHVITWSTDPKSAGYGGSIFEFNMNDGSVIKTGAWSGNHWYVNSLLESSDPMTHFENIAERNFFGYGGRCGIALHTRRQFILDWWMANRHKLDWGLALVKIPGCGVSLEPTRADGSIKPGGGIEVLKLWTKETVKEVV